MRSELMHRPLRFAIAQAYDPVLRGPGSLWVEQSVEELSLNVPIDASQTNEAEALSDSATTAEHSFRRAHIERICANPLRDEPDPLLVGAVRRFGLVGLVTCAVGTGLLRWWYSLTHRVH